MRKKIFDDKFYMPTQLDVGTAEKEDTEPTETPYPLAKGSDGLPKFNQLQDAQKESLKDSMEGQVVYQSEALQNSNLQIINFSLSAFATGTTSYVYVDLNGATAFGTYLNDYVLFENYININYITCVMKNANITINPESYVSFYLMQNSLTTPNGSAGMKIPRQIQAKKKEDATTITLNGTEQGAQSIAVPLTTQIFYNQADTMRGIRCKGLALSNIVLDLASSEDVSGIIIEVAVYVDKSTESSQL